MAKKPSLAEALGGSYGAPSGDHADSPDAAMYVKDLQDCLGLKPEKAQALYDVICAIVKSKAAGGELTISLG
jgi:hypothetical protein